MEPQIIFPEIIFILLGHNTAKLGNWFIIFLDHSSTSELLE